MMNHQDNMCICLEYPYFLVHRKPVLISFVLCFKMERGFIVNCDESLYFCCPSVLLSFQVVVLYRSCELELSRELEVPHNRYHISRIA